MTKTNPKRSGELAAYLLERGGVWFCAVTEGGEGLRSVSFSERGREAALRSAAQGLPEGVQVGDNPKPSTQKVLETLLRIYSGRGCDLPFDPPGEGIPPFALKILRLTQTVPKGFVTTYGDLAEAAGVPGAARAVGGAMASNPYPLLIPCHRVVRSDLSLGGYGLGVEAKRRLLEREGVEISKGAGGWRVSTRYRFKPNIN